MINISELIAAGKIDEAVNAVYDAVLGVINAGSPKMHLTRTDWNVIAPELIKKMQDPTSGTSSTPTPEPGDDVDVLDEFAYLVVKYVDATGEDVAPSITKKIFVGAPYTVNAVEVEGMEPDKDKATGEMTKDGATVTFTYTEKAAVTAKLHIEYTGPVGGDFVAPATVDEDVEVGTNYNVASPVVEGYTPDKAVVSGTMTEDGVNELIIYEKDEA